MTQWQITKNDNFPHRYAVKKYDGFIKIAGKDIFLPSGSIMVDDRSKTIFYPEEWEFFKNSGYDMTIYNMKAIFKSDIIIDKRYDWEYNKRQEQVT